MIVHVERGEKFLFFGMTRSKPVTKNLQRPAAMMSACGFVGYMN